jgi:hypothetical protein
MGRLDIVSPGFNFQILSPSLRKRQYVAINFEIIFRLCGWSNVPQIGSMKQTPLALSLSKGTGAAVVHSASTSSARVGVVQVFGAQR